MIKLKIYWGIEKTSLKVLQKNTSNIIFPPEESILHISKTKCDKWNCEFTNTNKKLKHHDHINGKFLGTSFNNCYFEYQYKSFSAVKIYNLKGYDAHLFITITSTVSGKKWGLQDSHYFLPDTVDVIVINKWAS